jgi:hypothetical protein
VRRTTAITSAATTVVDLSAFKGSYVEFYADQDLVFGFAATPGATLVVSGETTLTPLAPTDVGAPVVGRPAASRVWVHRAVDPRYPYLLLRAASASTALFVLGASSGGLTLGGTY